MSKYKDFIIFWSVYFIVFAVACFFFGVSLANADSVTIEGNAITIVGEAPEDDLANLEARREKILAMVTDEVKRQHEINVRAKEIEILARLKEFEAPKLLVNNYNRLEAKYEPNWTNTVSSNSSSDNTLTNSNDNNS